MLKRLLVALTGLVGVVVIGLGVASATLWRADDVLVAELRADKPLVVTEPGVLELADARVTVRVEADGPVVLAVGRDTDVAAWVGSDPHQRVTGLAGWHELAAEDGPVPTPDATAAPGDEDAGDEGVTDATPAAEAPAAPDASPAPEEGAAPEGDAAGAGAEDAASGETAEPTVPDPTGSDLWVVEATGDGAAELTWTAQPGRWSLLAASTDGSLPRLSLAWPQVVTTPWLWPCVVVGSLLVLAAGALLVRDVLRRRRPAEAAWTPVATGSMPVVGTDGTPTQLTRRQLRELAARGAAVGADRGAPHPEPPADAGPRRHDVTEALPPVRAGAAPGPQDGDVPAAPSGPVGGAAALAASTRRALRGVGRRRPDDVPAEAPAPEQAPAAPSAEQGRGDQAAAARRQHGTHAAPAGPGTPGTTGTPAAPPTGPAAPAASGAPAGHRAGAPRWSVGGAGPSPWTTGPVPPVPGAPSRPGSSPDAPAAARPGQTPAGPVPAGAGGAQHRGAHASAGPVPAASGARSTGPAPTTGAGHPAGRPAWLAGAGSGATLPPPGRPGSPDAPTPGPTGAARTGGTSGPTGGPRPGGPAGAHTASPGAPRPGWAPVPPAPGALSGRSAGPDAPRTEGRTASPEHGGARPAWLRDAPEPPGRRTGASGTSGPSSRADAWRRAWGLPADDASTSEQEEDR